MGLGISSAYKERLLLVAMEPDGHPWDQSM